MVFIQYHFFTELSGIIYKDSNLYKFSAILLTTLLIIIYSNANAQTTFEDVIKIERKLSLEDSIGIIPTSITIDKNGNFITTDVRTHKVSIYDQDGNLQHKYGRKGKGPGDFLSPIYTIRLSSGQLLTAEYQGKLSLFNAKGDSLIDVFNVQVIPLVRIRQINDDKILLIGRKIFKKQIKLLHIFDLQKETITRSFFIPPFSFREYGGVFASISNLASAAVKDGDIAATYAPFTKIHIYNSQAKLKQTIDFSVEHFKKIENIDYRLTRSKANEYITTFSMVDDIFWLENDNFLIRYYRFTKFNRKNRIKEKQYSLVNLKPDGTVLFEIEKALTLRTVYGSQLYFKNTNIRSEKELLEGVLK